VLVPAAVAVAVAGAASARGGRACEVAQRSSRSLSASWFHLRRTAISARSPTALRAAGASARTRVAGGSSSVGVLFGVMVGCVDPSSLDGGGWSTTGVTAIV
jgi:hypothetical protein